MKTIVSLFMVMVMAFALVSTVGIAGAANNGDARLSQSVPAYTDYIDSRDLPYKAGANDLQTPDVMGSVW
jgi:hypothetical protein